jgi:hypothetical protein
VAPLEGRDGRATAVTEPAVVVATHAPVQGAAKPSVPALAHNSQAMPGGAKPPPLPRPGRTSPKWAKLPWGPAAEWPAGPGIAAKPARRVPALPPPVKPAATAQLKPPPAVTADHPALVKTTPPQMLVAAPTVSETAPQSAAKREHEAPPTPPRFLP